MDTAVILPFISCITVTYGRTARLQEAIACFLEQTYSGPKEMLVLNTFPRQTLLGEFRDVRIINLKERPAALGLARNLAVQHSKGDVLCTFDDDDLYLPGHLDNFAKHFTDGISWVWLNKQFYAEYFKIKEIMRGSVNSVAFRRSAWELAGGYQHATVGEDKDFVGRMTAQTKGVKVNVEPTDITFVYSWGNNTYKTSGLGMDGPKHLPAHQRVAKEVDSFVSKGVEPVGVITLKPSIVHDPRAMVSEFFQKHSHLAPKKKAVCVVELGRFGDIINILPILKHINDTYGKPFLMVSKPFASLLDGVSYVEPWVVDLDNANINEAMGLARRNFKFVIQAQIWGKNYVQERQCGSYNEESWRMCGFNNRFADKTWMPCFDRRDRQREEALWNKLSVSKKPMMLVNVTKSISSPFPNGPKVLEAIKNRFSEHYQIVDLSGLMANRIYDLLGVFDRAAILISVDTALLHLAAASTIPVIAIVNPQQWAGSVIRGNAFTRVTYSEAEQHTEALLDSIEACDVAYAHPDSTTCPALTITPPHPAPQRKLFHVVERHEETNQTEIKRKQAAQKSWDALYSTGQVIPVHVWESARNAQSIGDRRALPYLKDVLASALAQCGDDDVVFWTNDDNWLHPELPDMLLFHCSIYDVCTSQRCEVRGDKLPSPFEAPESISRAHGSHMGRDLFAATKSWFVKHWNDIPDFILGASEFDLCLASMVRLHKGIPNARKTFEQTVWPAEIPRGYVAHQFHVPAWTLPQNVNSAPSQKWNRQLFKDFSEKHNLPFKFDNNNCI